MKPKIILASGSPRRKELLKQLIPEFEIKVSNVEETLEEGLTVYKQAERLAYIKAKAVFDETEGDRIVIGSDTMVARNNKIFGKPKNKEHAIKMIQEFLEGDRTHEVISGLCVLIQDGEKYKEFKTFDIVKVILRNMTYNEIERWVDTGKALDKAGAYAIQEEFCVYVEKIEGNHTTIIGLPMHKLYEIIKDYL